MSMYGQSEPVTLARDVKAVVIPAGDETTLAAGRTGFITQALGGSFTVYMDGNLFRISGTDADALGKAPRRAPVLPPGATDADVEQLVWDQLRTCFDPEIPINIVDLGLVYECRLEPREDGARRVKVKMTLTAPGCGMGEVLVEDVRDKLSLIPRSPKRTSSWCSTRHGITA
jgi:probable FeS assembly SUF system protein SufT